MIAQLLTQPLTIITEIFSCTERGPEAAATGYQKGELTRYPGINPKKFDFLRCVVETYGNFKDRVVRFCKELEKKRLQFFIESSSN